MPRRPSRRDAAWTLATCTAVAFASLAAWRSLEVLGESQQHRSTLQFARSIANEIEWRLNDQIRAARRLARFWVRFGRQPWDEWEFDTRLYLENNNLDSAVWIDPEFLDRVWEVQVGEPMKPAREEDLDDLVRNQEATVSEGVERFVGPLPLSEGGYAYWAAVPVGKNRNAALIAGRRLNTMFDAVLRTHAEQCAMQVRHLAEVLFSSRDPDCRTGVTVDVPIRAVGGRSWTLTIEPSPAVVGAGNPIPGIVLAGGLLTSALLGGVMWTRGTLKAGAVALVQANRRLQQSTRDARQAESEVRTLNLDLESRVRDRTSDLNDAVTELEAFNYSVSHDLRSPLGAIVNFAAILEQDYSDRLTEDGHRNLERIRSSAMAAIAMMDSLLEFSRAGRAPMRVRTVDIETLVREIWEELVALEPDGHGVLNVLDMPRCVADPTLLRLVVSNLLSNALKFSRARAAPLVEVGGRREDGHCVYWVKDNGVGFRPDAAEKIFRVFSRLHSASEYPGKGVGLAIVDRIVRRHGGRVWCEAIPDAGATFSFSLPGEAAS